MCDNDELCDDCEFWDGNGGKEVNTNADRIRAMSDEKLANELAKVASWDRAEFAKAQRIGLETFMKNWLKEPAEEGE